MKIHQLLVLFTLLAASFTMSASQFVASFDQNDTTQVTTAPAPKTVSGKSVNGVVEVVFRINQDGKAQVVDIQSTTPILKDYVLEKLKKIKLSESAAKPGQTIRYRFVFQDQQV